MVHRLSRLCRGDDGAAALVTILLISSVFIGLSALVVDLGLARDIKRQAQNAADASALAAGNVLYLSGGTANVTSAITAAKFYAASNYGVTVAEWDACTDASALAYHPPLDTACISFDSASSPASIRVTIPLRQVRTPFAQIWGVGSVPVSAVAQIQLVPGAQCGVCVLGTGTHNLQGGLITVSGANVAINGTLAANTQGSITVTGSGSSIGLQGSLPNNGTYSPAPLVNQPVVIDPLASLTMPDYSSLVVKTNSCTQGPGIYDSLNACANMSGGLYVLTGTTSLSGNNSIVANGVTLYFLCGTPTLPRACATGETGGRLNFGGGATLNVTAPTTGPTQGLSIVADRNNTATFSFGGSGSQTNSGTIYARSATLAYNGNGASGNLDSLVIVGDFSFAGNPTAFRSTYTQPLNVGVSSDLHLTF